MEKRLAVLVIHGMGDQGPDFADEFREDLLKRVKKAGYPPDAVAVFALYWADLTQKTQQNYFSAAEVAAKLGQRTLRRFVISAFGDATAYQRVRGGGAYEAIHERIRDGVSRLHQQLEGQDVPLVVMAHSLGGHIMSNYIWDLQHPEPGAAVVSPFQEFKTHAGFLTFGCNIPLFTFAQKVLVPIRFPGDALSAEVRAVAKWLNFYDKDDVLGWPLKPLGDAYDKTVAADIQVGVGNPLTSWNPASHTAYWEDDDFVKPAASYLVSVLKAIGVNQVRDRVREKRRAAGATMPGGRADLARTGKRSEAKRVTRKRRKAAGSR